MSNSLQEQIVQLIPSESLKHAIKETGYQLSDIALLATVFNCAPDFDSRINLIQSIQNSFTGEIKAYAARLISVQRQMREAFTRSEPAAVFELHIKETPDAYDETYLCGSFEVAMKMIPLFYQEYDRSETSLSRYRIVKRRVFSGSGGEVFAEDHLGEAVILPGAILYSIEMEGYRAEDCDGLCLECNRYSIFCNDIPYPCFTEDGDVVEYQQYDGSKKYGVVHQWSSEPTGDYYIIPLDGERIRYHDFANACYSHEHIAAYFVEKASPNVLPDKMKEDYLAYLEYINRNQ